MHTDIERLWIQTSINASWLQVPLANGPIKLWGRPVNQGTGLPRLCLCPPAVAKL